MFFQLDLLIGETWARLHGLEPLPIRWKAPGALKRPADIQVESRGAVYPTLGPKELQTWLGWWYVSSQGRVFVGRIYSKQFIIMIQQDLGVYYTPFFRWDYGDFWIQDQTENISPTAMAYLHAVKD